MGLFSGIKRFAGNITNGISKIPIVGGMAAGGLRFLGKHGLTIAGVGLSVAAIAGTGGLAAGPLAVLATRFPMLGKLAGSAGQIGSKIATSSAGRSLATTFGKFFGSKSAIGGAARTGLSTVRGWGSNLSSTLQGSKNLTAARAWGTNQATRAKTWASELRGGGSGAGTQQLSLFDDAAFASTGKGFKGLGTAWNNMSATEKAMTGMTAATMAPTLMSLPTMLAGPQGPSLV